MSAVRDPRTWPGGRLAAELFADQGATARRALAALAGSSVVGAAQFAVLNKAVLEPRSTGVQIGAGVLYALLLALAFWLRWRGAAGLVASLERMMLGRRRRIFSAFRAAELRTIEQADGLDAAFRRDVDAVLALAPILVDCIFYGALLVGFAVYLLAVDANIAFVWCATLVVIAWDLRRNLGVSRATTRALDDAWAQRRRRIEQMTRGFPLMRMDPRAADALRREAGAAGRTLDAARRERLACRHRGPTVASTIFYIGLAVVLFSPVLAAQLSTSARFEVIIIMFVSINSAIILAREIEVFGTADAALARLDAAEARLAGRPQQPIPSPITGFETIALDGVEFAYGENNAGFRIGPLDLELRRGEVVFITGGNGSGKTTLMKVLTGLYPPTRGRIRVDGRSVSGERRARYRTLFTSIFMDHHLFGPAYGLGRPDPARVHALLERFNLAGVVDFDGERFAPLDLSAGQRKRLAMVVALLEDRPIYVLDEWAAHQDPYLRRYFYETLVPEMKTAGKTVVAISHDARFFHLADRRLHLDGGRLVPAED